MHIKDSEGVLWWLHLSTPERGMSIEALVTGAAVVFISTALTRTWDRYVPGPGAYTSTHWQACHGDRSCWESLLCMEASRPAQCEPLGQKHRLSKEDIASGISTHGRKVSVRSRQKTEAGNTVSHHVTGWKIFWPFPGIKAEL